MASVDGLQSCDSQSSVTASKESQFVTPARTAAGGQAELGVSGYAACSHADSVEATVVPQVWAASTAACEVERVAKLVVPSELMAVGQKYSTQ